MLTRPQALEIQCAMIELRLQHPWHYWYPTDQTTVYIFDCPCSRCECVDELIVAVLAFIEGD